MFEQESAKQDTFMLRPAVTKSNAVTERKGCVVVVTDGSGSFYASRTLIQNLYSHGDHKAIIAYSDSAANAKKILISRTARYSGLLDVLNYAEGDEMPLAEAWIAVNVDESKLGAQIAAAQAAGVSRVFLVFTDSGPTSMPSDGVEERLRASGMAYTMMRTGELVDSAESGGGLHLAELDLPVCAAVGKEDVFRFVQEALTLPQAEGRTFSLCPSDETAGSLREMRLCGYERRDEVAALLSGHIEQPKPAAELTVAEAEEEKQLVMRSAAEVEAERAEELKLLIERARVRGEAMKAKMEYEEQERLAKRAELAEKYKTDVVVPDVVPKDLKAPLAPPKEDKQ